MNNKKIAESQHDWRFERKFYIENHSLHQIENEILRHPALFREVYYPRQVNNIYFDNISMKGFVDNVEGVSDRKKSRVRWYGETFGLIEKPVLEYKIKKGLLGRKEHFPLSPFVIDQQSDTQNLLSSLNNSDVPQRIVHEMGSLKPKLLNNYKRKYYLSADGRFRLTIDTEMKFMQPDNIHIGFNWKKLDEHNAVMELKYSSGDNDDKEARDIANKFSFRMTKNSKYVNGIEKLYFVNA